MEYEYPTLMRRLMASLLEFFFILLVMVAVAYLFPNEDTISRTIKVCAGLFLFFGYEPFCTSMYCTFGQYMTGIRVRKADDPEKHISIISAYIRIVLKVFLGWLSFFTMPFSDRRRAIHDHGASSVVIQGNWHLAGASN